MAYEIRNTKDQEHWLQMKREALQKRANGDRLTLEETACAIWDPKKDSHPMTCMGVLKIEKRALEKLKIALKKYNINDISDIIEPRHREFAKPISSNNGN